MEHGVAFVKYIIAILLTCTLLPITIARAEEQRIAVVASAESGIMTISAKDVRRAYLGATIVLDGVEIKPLLNQTDKLAGEVFLQKILFMSSEAYERQLLARAFRGGSSPKAYQNLAELLAALQNDKAAITFMLYETAIKTSKIRIIANL